MHLFVFFVFWWFLRILTPTIWAKVSLKMLLVLRKISHQTIVTVTGFNELGHPSYGLCTASFFALFYILLAIFLKLCMWLPAMTNECFLSFFS